MRPESECGVALKAMPCQEANLHRTLPCCHRNGAQFSARAARGGRRRADGAAPGTGRGNRCRGGPRRPPDQTDIAADRRVLPRRLRSLRDVGEAAYKTFGPRSRTDPHALLRGSPSDHDAMRACESIVIDGEGITAASFADDDFRTTRGWSAVPLPASTVRGPHHPTSMRRRRLLRRGARRAARW